MKNFKNYWYCNTTIWIFIQLILLLIGNLLLDFKNEMFNVLSFNKKVIDIINIIKIKVPNVKISLVRNRIMNQDSYSVINEKFKDTGFKYKDNLKKLKAEIAKDLAPIKDKPYVVFHDAYQYFETSFGLNAVGSVALEGDIASSPKQVSYIKDKIVKLKASCVFQEPQFDSNWLRLLLKARMHR